MEESLDRTRRDDLIAEYMRYVKNIAHMMVAMMDLPKSLYDDLVAGGLLGLVEAAERFDFKSGTSFKGFAFFRIRGAMIDCLRRLSDFSGRSYRMVRALESYSLLREEYQHCIDQGQRKTKKRRLEEILELASQGALAYRLCFSEEENEAPDELLNCSNAEQMLSRQENFKKMSFLVETLPEKERMIIEEYYFHGLSFIEITEKHPNLSKSWVSKLHKRGLQILKKRMLEAWGEAPV